MKNVLLIDALFPSKYAKWRIAETKSFIEHYSTDILVVRKVETFAKVDYTIDYEEMFDYYRLAGYNILIFDPAYNYLNKYNDKIDGTKFNGLNKAAYMFTKYADLDLSRYDIVYHIFLSMYREFNKQFNFPMERQVVHLYPGGGMKPKEKINLHKKTRAISTMRYTSDRLNSENHKNYIEVPGGTFLQKGEIIPSRNRKQEKLRVCYSNMGIAAFKGSATYVRMTKKYRELFPNDNIEFISIGNLGNKGGIKRFEPMAQFDLDKFYHNNVDILVTLSNNKAYNGWPLGSEALFQGVFMITTDPVKENRFVNYPEEGIAIVRIDDVLNICAWIHVLYRDRERLSRMSRVSQKFMLDTHKFENKQGKIFKYCEETLKSSKV